MSIINPTISSRDFNRDVGPAKRAAINAPVIITEHKRPAFVLMSYEIYTEMVGQRAAAPRLSAVDALSFPPAAAIEFDSDRRAIKPRALDLD